MQHYINSFIVVIVLWGVIFAPLKLVVKQIVGKGNYKLIISEYRQMKRDRMYGAAGIILGLLGILSVNNIMSLGYKFPPGIDENLFKMFPFIFVAGGFYCYLMGFMKALAMTIKSKSVIEIKEVHE